MRYINPKTDWGFKKIKYLVVNILKQIKIVILTIKTLNEFKKIY